MVSVQCALSSMTMALSEPISQKAVFAVLIIHWPNSSWCPLCLVIYANLLKPGGETGDPISFCIGELHVRETVDEAEAVGRFL